MNPNKGQLLASLLMVDLTSQTQGQILFSRPTILIIYPVSSDNDLVWLYLKGIPVCVMHNTFHITRNSELVTSLAYQSYNQMFDSYLHGKQASIVG